MRRRDLLLAIAIGAVLAPAGLACNTVAAGPAPRELAPANGPQGARPALPQRSIAVRAERLHTMAGPVIEDGVVWIENGLVRAVGPAGSIELPAGIEILTAKVATPGLVDAHTVVGLAGWLNEDADKDELDTTAAMQPELRALDAYNPNEPLVGWVRSFGVTTVHTGHAPGALISGQIGWVRSFGVTTVHTGHAPGALISGQTLIAKTRGDTVEAAVMVPDAMVTAALGDGARGGFGAPGSRARAAAMLRQELHAAARWTEDRARDAAKEPEEGETTPTPARDLRKEALARVLAGEVPLLLTAHRAHDLMTALRIAEEFPNVRLILDGASEAPLVIDAIRAAGVAVIVHPTMRRTGGESEALAFTTPQRLLDAGIPTALQSGYEDYVPRTRVVLFEAAIAARYGLEFERALGLITKDAAALLGIADRVGTLEVGKHGDVALFDGDPFEYTSHCTAVVIEGERSVRVHVALHRRRHRGRAFCG